MECGLVLGISVWWCSGSPSCAKLLLEAGAQTRGTDAHGNTAFHIVASYAPLGMMEPLLQELHAADRNQVRSGGASNFPATPRTHAHTSVFRPFTATCSPASLLSPPALLHTAPAAMHSSHAALFSAPVLF